MTSQVTTNHPTVKSSSTTDTTTALPTFMDHIRELQGRLFIIAIAFVLAAGAAYPFFEKIAALILAPLGKDNQLVYLTPGGAFSFIIKVCLYVGIIAILPLVIYHLYRFVMPAVKTVHLKVVLGYTVASLVLAICGIMFAYFVSLPASLYFLTGFQLYHINPMITIDSYFSFVMTYLLAGALLFQIPLIMMIIDSATPLKPSKLMKYQRHIIVGSFIIAAVISPTPDALNQTILASPMVGMYQVGVLAIWSSGRRRDARLQRRTGNRRTVRTSQTARPVAGQSLLRPTGHHKQLEMPSLDMLAVDSVPAEPARQSTAIKVQPASMPAAATTQLAPAVTPPAIKRQLPSRPQPNRQSVVISARYRREAFVPVSRRQSALRGRSVDGIMALR